MSEYLLFAGLIYYPGQNLDDWIGHYPTIESAQEAVKPGRHDWACVVEHRTMKVVSLGNSNWSDVMEWKSPEEDSEQ